MKYIRTKDGRIFDLNRFENISSPVSKTRELIILIDKNKICDYEISQKDIIKQADTIEELCDEFVYRWLPSNTYSIMPREDLEPQRRNCLLFHIEEKHHDVLGAIWTDKGLIYVAKMNERGELVLL